MNFEVSFTKINIEVEKETQIKLINNLVYCRTADNKRRDDVMDDENDHKRLLFGILTQFFVHYFMMVNNTRETFYLRIFGQDSRLLNNHIFKENY